jgi:hypothetical protein
MAKSVAKQIEAEVEAHLQQSYNRLINTVMRRLATKKRSPVYTGFFASSWKADTSPINAQDKVEENAPWSQIKATKRTNPASKDYRIDPRFYPPSKAFSYKKRVYIGNTAEYAIYALEDGRIQQFVQGSEMKSLVDAAFKERKAKISVGSRQATGAFGNTAGKIYTGYSEV